MDCKALKIWLIFISLLNLSGCDGDNDSDDVEGYKLTWETSFSIPDGYQPLRADSNEHHFRIDMYGNAYLSFAKSESDNPPYMGLEDIAIWQFDGSDWYELPELPQDLEADDQDYYLPQITSGDFTLIYFRDVNVGVPWRASQTDSIFSTNRYDSQTRSWSEYTLLDEDYLNPDADYKMADGEALYAEVMRYIQLEPTSCDPDWIEGCYTWDEESVYLTLGEDGWSEVDSTTYDQVVSETFRVVYTVLIDDVDNALETQLEALVDGNWQTQGEVVAGEYSLYVDKLKGEPYLYAGSEVLQECGEGWCNLLDGYDLGQNPIDGIYIDLSDNIYIYQASDASYSLYKFSNLSK